MLDQSWLYSWCAYSPQPARHRAWRRFECRLQVEPLEFRELLSSDYLLFPDLDKHNVLRYDADTGAFVDEFVSKKSGGLNQPWNVVIGPHDENLYVPSGHFRGPGQIKAVLRYDGTTGVFLDEFV